MKIVCISDTHCQLGSVTVPSGDLLIHSGDFTYRGTVSEIAEEMQELKKIADYFTYGAVIIAGNHDWLFERDPGLARTLVPSNVKYLNDQETEIDGLRIWGSPVQPAFGNWAFNRMRGSDIQRHWDMIPAGVDILITHGPVYGLLDTVNIGAKVDHVGCMNLLKTMDRVKPRLHVCGHIHEGHGEVDLNGTKYVNASLLDDYYNKVYDPIIVEL